MIKKMGKTKEKAAQQDIKLLARSKVIPAPGYAVEELKLGCFVLLCKWRDLNAKAKELGFRYVVPSQVSADAGDGSITVKVSSSYYCIEISIEGNTAGLFDEDNKFHWPALHSITAWQKLLPEFPNAVADIVGQIKALDEKVDEVSRFVDDELEALAANAEKITAQMKQEYAELLFDEF